MSCARPAASPGSEEYLDSEKYEMRPWDLNHADSLRGLFAASIAFAARIRALQFDAKLHFHATANDQPYCFATAGKRKIPRT